MDAIAIPDWIRDDPTVERLSEFHLPLGSGISGPPAAAFLSNTDADNALQPFAMWHLLLHTTDEEIAWLQKSHTLVLALSIVPIFMVYPLMVDPATGQPLAG